MLICDEKREYYGINMAYEVFIDCIFGDYNRLFFRKGLS